MKARTPMMQQYFQAKEAHPGVLMAMRVGDFYEFYGEDAETAAAVLQITLTGRDDGANGRVAMAGVPHHSVEKYLTRLVSAGHKVALCDQTEDPKLAKGLVRREVTRVLTPGTVVEEAMLEAGANSFLSALARVGERVGLATLDPSTGEFGVTEFEAARCQEIALQEIARLRPRELLFTPDVRELAEVTRVGLEVALTEAPTDTPARAERKLLDLVQATSLSGFGLADQAAALLAAAMVVTYAQKNGLNLQHVSAISTYAVDQFMALDLSTRRALELTSNLMDGGRRFTLLSVMDETVTAPGTRLLRRWLEQPLLDREAILRRQQAVQRLVRAGLDRSDLRDHLKCLGDLERLVSRCATGVASPRDVGALRSTLLALPALNPGLEKVAEGRLAELQGELADHSALATTLRRAIVDDPPNLLRDGGVIAPGFDAELDAQRALAKDGRAFIARLEAEERERTGISTLKVGFNSVFGYYLEIGKAHQARVPAHYLRKQTTANAERYITAELKDQEAAVLGASDKATQLEQEIFGRLRAQVTDHAAPLLRTARAIAEIDVLAGLAEVAVKRDLRCPEFLDDDVLTYTQGRHPVVEAHAPGRFVPNDLTFDAGERLMVLTGPNMSGKSTFLRQTALIALLAHVGSFVPAKSCRLGLCDRIFSRIGAKDEIALGQSTFMVEMIESAFILHHATDRSLVVLDEVGRGTSTYDGLAIAWAMLERLHQIGAKTCFATHYHQLNQLSNQLPRVRNYRVSVKEMGEEVVWTHRVLPGGTDRSYGIHVARMAGMPRTILERAQEILHGLEATERPPTPKPVQTVQLTLFEAEPTWLERQLRELDVDDLTPRQALELLSDWRAKMNP